MKRTVLLLLTLMQTLWLSAQGIGSWNFYPAYGNIKTIQPAGKLIYVLSSKGLFSYNINDGSIQTYHKMNFLSDCSIDQIAYSQKANRLVIVYENQNIDVLDNNENVTNISDYYNKSMSSSKTINSVSISGEYAYLNTAFGIIRINVEKGEITATYSLDMDVKTSCIYNGVIYAATNTEVWLGDMKKNLLDKSNWTKMGDLHFNYLFNINNHLYALTDNSIMEYSNNNWVERVNVTFDFFTLTGNKLVLGTGNQMQLFDGELTTIRMDENNHTTFAYDATNNMYWTNQDNGKLCALQQNDGGLQTVIANIQPDGPATNDFYYIRVVNNIFYSCGGGFHSGDKLIPGNLQIMDNGNWTCYNATNMNYSGNAFFDLMSLDVDPRNKDHVFIGARTGVFEILNGKINNYYNNDNSLLSSALDTNDNTYVLVFGTSYDASGNLWVLNSQAKNTNVLCLDNSGKWHSYPQDTFWDKENNGRSLAHMRHSFIDKNGRLWFANNHYNTPSFGYYDTKNNQSKLFTSFTNQDGTSYHIDYVHTVAEDKEGNIWAGTVAGPFILPANEISTNDGTGNLTQIKVPRNDGTNFADYLLNGVDVTCMAIDGGNRKWIGTNGQGLYLISADNMTQIHHFLSSDSKLVSNNIIHLAINDQTGEVFIATDKGLCSYMSDATEVSEEMTDDNVYAYPNPVTPEYKGLITVVGLSYNADIKITTTNGVLVAEGRSNGGTFTWDGCDKKGHRVASGVYMVHTATSDGNKGTVCKIAIVN